MAGPATSGVDSEGRSGGVLEVRDKLRAAILQGDLPAGEAMSRGDLADFVSASRTPFREALRMVQAEGLIEMDGRHLVTIAPLTIGHLEQIQIMRISMEGSALRIAVPRISPEEIGALEGLMAQMDHFVEHGDYERMETAHFAFHTGLVAPAGETIMEKLTELNEYATRYRRAYSSDLPEHWEHRQRAHRMILDAVMAGKSDLAAALLARHYAGTVDLIADSMGVDYSGETVEIAVKMAAGSRYSAIKP